MRVLVVAEGNHELGNSQTVGALPVLVMRLAGGAVEIECEKVSSPKVRVHLKPGKSPHGFVKRGQGWIRHAEREGFDALVFLVDEDGDRERVEAVNFCQANLHFFLPRAMGVAIRTFDAWILADEQALSIIRQETTRRQSDPETVSDPKEVCESLRTTCSVGHSPTVFYAQVVQHADLETIAKRCPKGFAPFATRIRALRS